MSNIVDFTETPEQEIARLEREIAWQKKCIAASNRAIARKIRRCVEAGDLATMNKVISLIPPESWEKVMGYVEHGVTLSSEDETIIQMMHEGLIR